MLQTFAALLWLACLCYLNEMNNVSNGARDDPPKLIHIVRQMQGTLRGDVQAGARGSKLGH